MAGWRGVARGLGGHRHPAAQHLPTSPARLEDETRKREDAEHNLVLFRKVSEGSRRVPTPQLHPQLRLQGGICGLGEVAPSFEADGEGLAFPSPEEPSFLLNP